MRRIHIALAAVAVTTLALASGCGTTSSDGASSSSKQADAISVSNMWVKSAKAGAMTAEFGTLKNDSDAKITITAAKSPVSPMMQLHETVKDSSGNMVMQQKKGGFVVPAHGSFTLQPGSNHIMFMGLSKTLSAGDEVTVTLTFKDGSTYPFTAVVKDFAGANENYSGGHSGSSATPSASPSTMAMK